MVGKALPDVLPPFYQIRRPGENLASPGVDLGGAVALIEALHGSDTDDDPDRFRLLVTFDAQDNGKTVVTLRQLHPTPGRRSTVIGFGAVEYGGQTLDKLALHAEGAAGSLKRFSAAVSKRVHGAHVGSTESADQVMTRAINSHLMPSGPWRKATRCPPIQPT